MADQQIQSRIGWEEMEEDQGHTLWEQNVIEEKQNMQMLVDKIWLLMSETNRGPSYHISPHVFTPKEDQEGWTNGRFPHTKLKLCTVTEFEGSTYPTFNRFPDFNRVSHNRTKFIIIPFFSCASK